MSHSVPVSAEPDVIPFPLRFPDGTLKRTEEVFFSHPVPEGWTRERQVLSADPQDPDRIFAATYVYRHKDYLVEVWADADNIDPNDSDDTDSPDLTLTRLDGKTLRLGLALHIFHQLFPVHVGEEDWLSTLTSCSNCEPNRFRAESTFRQTRLYLKRMD